MGLLIGLRFVILIKISFSVKYEVQLHGIDLSQVRRLGKQTA